MATAVEAVAETLPKVLSSVYASGGFPKMPERDDNNKYRFYHCILGNDRNRCKKIDNPNHISLGENTHILSINNWIPESLDTYLLRFENPFVTKVK